MFYSRMSIVDGPITLNTVSTFESYAYVNIAGMLKKIFKFRMVNVRLFPTSVSIIIIMIYTEYRIPNSYRTFSWINNFIRIQSNGLDIGNTSVCIVHTKPNSCVRIETISIIMWKIQNQQCKTMSHRYWVHFLWCLGDLHFTRACSPLATHIQMHYSPFFFSLKNP